MTECKVGWTRGFVGSWAGIQPWKHQCQWASTRSTTRPRQRECFRAPVAIGPWCLVLGQVRVQGGDGNPEKLALPAGAKTDEQTSPASPPIGLVAWWDHHGQGSAVATGWRGWRGMEEGRGRRAGSSVVLLQDEKETAETRKIQAKSIRGTTGERDARLSRGWRAAQMINTYIHGQRAGQHELPVLLPRSGVRLMGESAVMESKTTDPKPASRKEK